MTSFLPVTRHGGTRRAFLHRLGGASLLLATGALFAGCGGSDDENYDDTGIITCQPFI